MNQITSDKCPKCKKEGRIIYDNETAYCKNCNSDFDLGMKKFRVHPSLR